MPVMRSNICFTICEQRGRKRMANFNKLQDFERRFDTMSVAELKRLENLLDRTCATVGA